MFYVELHRKDIFAVIIKRANIFGRFGFIKKGVDYIFSLDIYGAVGNIFKFLSPPGTSINFNVNLYRRPGIYFDLFYFSLAYNFFITSILHCMSMVASLYRLTIRLGQLGTYSQDLIEVSFKTGLFFMVLLLISDILIALLILYFI